MANEQLDHDLYVQELKRTNANLLEKLANCERLLNYPQLLQAGLEYEDYIVDCFWRRGWLFQTFSSRKWAHEAESITPIEIKYDAGLALSGNIYVETHERMTTDQEFRESGILRADGVKLWIIGDYDVAYVIPKRALLHAHRHEAVQRYEGETSKAMLLGANWRCRNAAWKEEFTSGDKARRIV